MFLNYFKPKNGIRPPIFRFLTFEQLRFVRVGGSPVALIEKIDKTKNYTAVAGNGVIVSWHPDQPFPYEHSQPLPVEEEAKSPLTEELNDKFRAHYFRRKGWVGPTKVDLRNMFYLDVKALNPRFKNKRIEKTVTPTPPARKGF